MFSAFWPSWSMLWKFVSRPFSGFLRFLVHLWDGAPKMDIEHPESYNDTKTMTSSAKESPKTINYLSIPGLWEREINPNLPDGYFKIPLARPGEIIYVTKGKLLAWGGTAILERLPSGEVIKTPKPHPVRHESHCQSMCLEARIYQTLGEHPRIPRSIGWDSKTCCITMEYLDNSNLREYVRENHENISLELRHRWVKQTVEGLKFLHSHKIIHCDISPRNFLLDINLNLKISDFGGASMSGSEPSAVPGTRFRYPISDWDAPPVFDDDIFSLGSLIYFIMTGSYPYEEVLSDEVETLYKTQQFPDVSHLTCGAIINQCWGRQGATAEAIYKLLEDF